MILTPGGRAHRIPISRAAAREAARLLAARDRAEDMALSFFRRLAAANGVRVEELRGIDDQTNELLIEQRG